LSKKPFPAQKTQKTLQLMLAIWQKLCYNTFALVSMGL
jgi:hypothetical protein